ncbi:MAG: VOC family protein [Dehalococcoidia bacterium]|mgnify:FL=1
MSYSVNHVHIRAKDPQKSAEWYEKYFDAKILSSREVMPGTITVSMDAGGPVRLNISSQPEGSSDDTIPAELNRLGLEHFGFDTDDIEADIQKFEKDNIRVVLPITEIPGGTKLAYIEGPDKVLIELVQPAHN